MWRLLLIFLSLCFFPQLRAQNAPIKIEIASPTFSLFHWTTENGLPQNNVQTICQDQSGFLWISTFDGLSRFDGRGFTNYDEGNIKGLTSSTFLEMFNDKAQNVWFTTNEQIGRITNGKIKSTYQTSGPRPELLMSSSNLFVKSNSTLFLIDSSKYQINSTENLDDFKIVCHSSPSLLMKENKLYSFSESMQLNYLGEYQKVSHLGSNIIRAETEDQKIQLFQFYSNEIVPFEFSPQPSRFNAENAVSIHESKGYTIVENKDSLFIYKSNENLLAESKDLLNIRKVKCTFVNENNQIYLGTNGQGMFLFNPKKLKSFESDDMKHSVNGHMVYYSDEKQIYMDGGCNQLLEINSNLEPINSTEVQGCPWTMLYDYESNLWINGHIEDTTNSTYQHRELNQLLNKKIIYSLFEYENTIYVGTNKGVYFCNNETAGLVANTAQLKAIYMFYINQNNELLFCSDKGVGFIQHQRAEIAFKGDETGDFNDIRCVYQDNQGYYWIGSSKNGLGVLFENKLFRFPYSDGRLNKNVWCIIEDDLGYLWMNSNQGIYRANREELMQFAKGELLDFTSMHFTEADGLKSSEGNSRTQNKAFKDVEGNIWFSMITGPAIIDPSSINEDIEAPIILDYIEVDGINVNPNNPTIPPDFSQVGFAFAQNNSTNVNLSYIYKLGDENSWNIVGNEKFVSFSELSPGSYELMIKRAGSDYTLNIPFTVEAHFYQNDIFKYINAVLITGGIFFGIFLLWRNNRRIKARKKKQDAELKSLELVALQSQMNPHFVFNCLSSISALYISGNQQSANFYMSRFSSLLRIILEHAQKRLITLREDLEMFDIYVPLEGLQFDEPFDFELIVDPSLPKDSILIPSMVTHTFIENAIKHGLKPLKNRKGKLTITVDKYEDCTRVCIEDNGIGYEDSIKAKKSKVMIHRSHGLKNTGKRIELINLLNDLNITVDTVNLKDEHGTSVGTKVTILFPYIEQHNNENARN